MMSPVLIKGLMGAGFLSMGGVGVWQLTEYMAPKTLQQKLEREGYTFHPFEDDGQLEGWKKLAKKYKENTPDNNDKFSGFELTSDTDNSEVKKLRDKCREVAHRESGIATEAQDIKQLKKWCVVNVEKAASSNAVATIVN